MTTPLCFYSNKGILGNSERVQEKSWINFDLFSPNYSHTIMNFSKYLCCRKNKNIGSNIITSSLTVQVTFILPLTVITNLCEARIPLVTFEKNTEALGHLNRVLKVMQ